MYADVIINRSVERLDRSYQYRIPPELQEQAVVGAAVKIPFGRGNSCVDGYIVGLSEEPEIDPDKLKDIVSVPEEGCTVQSQLLRVAGYIHSQYGSTMNDCIRTVMPVRTSVRQKQKRYVRRCMTEEQITDYLAIMKDKKNCAARVKLLARLQHTEILPMEQVEKELTVSISTVRAMEKLHMVELVDELQYRNPIQFERKADSREIMLNEEQQEATNRFLRDYENDVRCTYLLHGITGSGKTEVYLSIIESVIRTGKQVIMLIPEISLTFQTVQRFYERLGDRISILNSRMSAGERYDQYLRAQRGELDVMIGPRSALFTPFEHLGLIILDEEHEGSYKSEMPPKYHAREVAVYRAGLAGASVILGSATPSIEAYYRAQQGEYKLLTLSKRGSGALPSIEVIDLREELRAKNRSVFSRSLQDKITDRLEKGEQIMLFLNRRGYAGFVSCRSCGKAIRCPHCEVSMTSHKGRNKDLLVCHFCGHTISMPKTCPSCGSPYIGGFGLGTQKVEELVRKNWPQARVLRMDMDTTSGKDGHKRVLEQFAKGEADILIGTQMIVKGHDFPRVTLMGILAADMSLNSGDYRGAERTFQILMQAAGRAGRGEVPGDVVIQTYDPEHYSIVTAAEQNYRAYYEQEMSYRKLLHYPPISDIMAILVIAKEQKLAERASAYIAADIRTLQKQRGWELWIVGPAPATVAKARDRYRQVIYLRTDDSSIFTQLTARVEMLAKQKQMDKYCSIQLDHNPMNLY